MSVCRSRRRPSSPETRPYDLANDQLHSGQRQLRELGAQRVSGTPRRAASHDHVAGAPLGSRNRRSSQGTETVLRPFHRSPRRRRASLALGPCPPRSRGWLFSNSARVATTRHAVRLPDLAISDLSDWPGARRRSVVEFTTETPGAHEFQHGQQRAIPPKDPVPMLRGTAMTGRSTIRRSRSAMPPPCRHGHDHIGLGEGVVVSEQTVEAATPQSYRRSTRFPRASATSAASSATGMSAVPATRPQRRSHRRRRPHDDEAGRSVIGMRQPGCGRRGHACIGAGWRSRWWRARPVRARMATTCSGVLP